VGGKGKAGKSKILVSLPFLVYDLEESLGKLATSKAPNVESILILLK